MKISSKEAQAMFMSLTSTVIPTMVREAQLSSYGLSDYERTTMELYKKLSLEFAYVEDEAQYWLRAVERLLSK